MAELKKNNTGPLESSLMATQIKNNSGDKITNATKAIIQSMTGLKNDLYIP